MGTLRFAHPTVDSFTVSLRGNAAWTAPAAGNGTPERQAGYEIMVEWGTSRPCFHAYV